MNERFVRRFIWSVSAEDCFDALLQEPLLRGKIKIDVAIVL